MRCRWIGCLIGLVSLWPLYVSQSSLEMDRQLASMFASDDPALMDYQRLQVAFGGNLVVMLVYDDDDLMSSDGWMRSLRWTKRVESIKGVEGVLSVAKLVDVFQYMRPSLPFASQSAPKLFDNEDSVAEKFRELFAGYTHSADERTAAVVAMLRPNEVASTLREIRVIADEMSATMDQRVTVVGEPVLLEDAFDLILADGRRLALGTVGLLCLVILVSLRDLRVVLLSSVCIVWTTLATRAAMVGLGIELSLVSSILIAIVAVIVVASIMHVGTGVRRGYQGIAGTLAMLAIPITVTCFTDAAGFMSLIVSDVRPVRQFGFMTATAAIAVLVSLLLFTPAIMGLSRRLRWSSLDSTPINSIPANRIAVPLRRLASASVNGRRSLGWLTVVLIAGCGMYVSTLKTNTSFLDNFRDESEIVHAYQRVEDRLGGAGVMDIVLPAPEIISSGYMKDVLELETRLREIRVERANTADSVNPAERAQPGKSRQAVRLTKVLSIADADAIAGEVALLAVAPPEVRLAGMRSAIPAFAEALMRFPDPERPTTPRSLRIMLRCEEALSGDEKAALLESVRREVNATSFGIEALNERRIIVTGYSILMSQLVASLVSDQWWALLTAFASVGGLIWLVTKRFSETVAALLVNTLPILVVLSLTGVLGGELDLGSAMIGAVSIGLSIDGSVHFLASYHRRLNSGHEVHDAAVEAAADLGTPILLASLALVVGFGVLITSPFVPTATFGLLVSATLAASSIANLSLLPAMVVWMDGRQPSRR